MQSIRTSHPRLEDASSAALGFHDQVVQKDRALALFFCHSRYGLDRKKANPDRSLTFLFAIEEGFEVRVAISTAPLNNLEEDPGQVRDCIGEPQVQSR